MSFSIFAKNSEANEYDVRTGLHGPLPREAYDSLPCLSNTTIKKWAELESTPTEFAWWLKSRWEESGSTSALSKGSALDSLITDVENMPDRFLVFTPAGPKKITQAHRDANPGKIVMAHADFQEALEMAKALQASPHTSQGEDLRHCGKEVAIANLFGVPFKCEFDLWADDTENITDIKSARSVTPSEFGKAFVDFSYDFQASLYLSIARELGFDKTVFNFLCVKNSAPYTVKPYRFRPFENQKHREIFNGCMARVEALTQSLLKAMENGFAEDLRWDDLTIPEWSVRQRSAEALLLSPA